MILDDLKEMQETAYADFQSKLVPTVGREKFIGIRVPKLRLYAKQIQKMLLAQGFMAALPHFYYEENILQAILISDIKDFSACLNAVERFLPYIDNWAVCDTLRPKCFCTKQSDLLPYIDNWLSSSSSYICRFAIEMLMLHYLDDSFSLAVLEKVQSISSDDYYVEMMQAWFWQTALRKQWQTVLLYLSKNKITPSILAKTLRKCMDSRAFCSEQKDLIKKICFLKSVHATNVTFINNLMKVNKSKDIHENN